MSLVKRYIFWTYERGSFHYDVMVTIILLFIFLSPRFIDFGDRPVREDHVHGHDILVQASGGGAFVYQVSVKELQSVGGPDLEHELVSSIEPITGPVMLDRYEIQKDNRGKIEAYKVFAHRSASAPVQ